MLTTYDSGDRSSGSHLDTSQYFRPHKGRREGRPKGYKPSPRENAAVARKKRYASELRAGSLDNLSTSGAFHLACAAAKPERLKEALEESKLPTLAALAARPKRQLHVLAALGRLDGRGQAPPLLTLECAAKALRTTVEGARWALLALAKAKLVEVVSYFVPNFVPRDLEHLPDPELRRAAVQRKLPHSERGKVYRLAPHVREALRLLRVAAAIHKQPQPSPKGFRIEREPSGSGAPAAAALDAGRSGDHVLSMAAQACGLPDPDYRQAQAESPALSDLKRVKARRAAPPRKASDGMGCAESLLDELHATAVETDDPDLRELFDELRARLARTLGKGSGGTPT